MEQQNRDMLVGVVTEIETDNDDVSVEQLLSTTVAEPFQSGPPPTSPGFFDLTLWFQASDFDFNTYSPPRSTNDVDSLQYQSPSPAIYEGLSPLREASGFDCCNSYSPRRTITPVMPAHNFTTVDSDGQRGSYPSPRGTSTTRLRPNLDGKKSKLIFKVSREELMNYLQVFRKLVRPKFADAMKESNIQDTNLILQVTRMPTELVFSYHDIFQWALQFAAEGDCAQSKTMRGSTLEDLAFVETIDSAMDEEFDLTLQCVHISQIAISTVQFTSDQAESGNPQHNLSKKVASTHCSKVKPECVMELDYSSEFTTFKIFKNRDALIEWASAVGRKNGFVVVVKRSDAGAGSKKPRITLGCQRSGYYRDMRNTELHQDRKLKMISTKKCGCPFELKGQKLDMNDDWTLQVICGKHNHHIVSHTTAEKGIASTQDATWIVTIMATYGDNTAKFQISSTSGINELKEKVARRLELEPGSFNVKYEDGGKLILIACDEALKEYVECSTSSLGNRLISLVVTDKVANSGSSCKKSRSGEDGRLIILLSTIITLCCTSLRGL